MQDHPWPGASLRLAYPQLEKHVAGCEDRESFMVQVIENRAELHGHVSSIRSDELRPEHKVVTIEVETTAPVEGYPNLLVSTAGRSTDIVFPSAAVPDAVEVGTKVRCRVRRAGPTTIVGDHCARF